MAGPRRGQGDLHLAEIRRLPGRPERTRRTKPTMTAGNQPGRCRGRQRHNGLEGAESRYTGKFGDVGFGVGAGDGDAYQGATEDAAMGDQSRLGPSAARIWTSAAGSAFRSAHKRNDGRRRCRQERSGDRSSASRFVRGRQFKFSRHRRRWARWTTATARVPRRSWAPMPARLGAGAKLRTPNVIWNQSDNVTQTGADQERRTPGRRAGAAHRDHGDVLATRRFFRTGSAGPGSLWKGGASRPSFFCLSLARSRFGRAPSAAHPPRIPLDALKPSFRIPL